jgi:hypothetical protein
MNEEGLMEHRVAMIVKTASAVCLVLVLAVQAFAQEQASLAESYLAGLARKSRNARNLGGGLSLGLGALSIGLGIAAQEDTDGWPEMNKAIGQWAVISGGSMALGGLVALSIASPAERAYKKARLVQDPEIREQRCAAALTDLARKGRRGRQIGAGLILATSAVLVLVRGDEISSGTALSYGITCGGLALSRLLIKSPAERTHAAYLKKSRITAAPHLTLGVGPRRSMMVGLSLDF